jgi:hypothetical protein
MALLSNSLKELVLDSAGYAHILTGVAAGAGSGGAGKIYVYAGVDPGSADAALTGQTLLGTITADAGATPSLLFAVATGGVLPKKVSQTWSTGAMTIAGGPLTATYARFCEGAGSEASLSVAVDAGGTSVATPRVHLTIRGAGQPAGDINLTSTAFANGDNFQLDNFQLQL